MANRQYLMFPASQLPFAGTKHRIVSRAAMAYRSAIRSRISIEIKDYKLMTYL